MQPKNNIEYCSWEQRQKKPIKVGLFGLVVGQMGYLEAMLSFTSYGKDFMEYFIL
jgi:hypothetical protein